MDPSDASRPSPGRRWSRALLLLPLALLCAAALAWPWSARPPARAKQTILDTPPTTVGPRLRGRHVIPDDSSRATARLPASIDGTVRDTGSTAIPHAEVCAWSTAAEAVDAVPTCASTDLAGHYRLEITARAFVMSATANGFLPSHAPSTAAAPNGTLALAPGERRRGVDFRVSRGGVPLRGAVTDVFGGAIEGAIVTLAHGWAGSSAGGHNVAGTPVLARTAADGTFCVWLAPGRWALDADALGYSEASIATDVPGASVAIALVPEATLSGIVVDRVDGAAVPGARIVLRQWKHGIPQDRAVGEADDAGRFRIGGLAPGRYRPGAIAGDRLGESEHSVSVELAESVEGVRIELVRGATLSAAVVVSPDARPCPGGSVSLVEPASRDARIASVAPDGSVTIDGLAPGRYDLAIACDDHSSEGAAKSVQIDLGENAATWTVQPGRTIRGEVVDSQGVGLLAEVAAIAAGTHGDGSFRRARTNSDGTFELRGVGAGPHSVDATAGARPRIHTTIDVDRDVVEVVLRARPMGKLRGTVARRRTALDHVEIRARPMSVPRFTIRTESDDRGAFAFDGLLPGRYEVLAADDAEVQLAAQTVEIRADSTVEIALEAGATASIVGTLVDADGQPVADAAVAAIASSALSTEDDRVDALRERAAAGSRGTVLTDAEGRFTIPDLARETTYTVLAQRRGGGVATRNGVATGSTLALRLGKLAAVVGTVSATGSVTALSVALRRRDGGSSHRESFRFGTTFEFERVPPGHYDVIAVAREGRGRSSVDVDAGQRVRVAVELQANRTYRGRFTDIRTGAPVPDVYAVIEDEDADASVLATKAEQLIASRPDGVFSGRDGTFTVADTPSATARLLAISADLGGGVPTILEFIVIAPGAEQPGVVDIPVVTGKQRPPAGSPGFALDTPMFCTDTPRVASFATERHPAGLAIGDEIVAIDGHDTTGLRCYLARGLLGPPVGDRVELTLRDGRVVTVALQPQE